MKQLLKSCLFLELVLIAIMMTACNCGNVIVGQNDGVNISDGGGEKNGETPLKVTPIELSIKTEKQIISLAWSEDSKKMVIGTTETGDFNGKFGYSLELYEFINGKHLYLSNRFFSGLTKTTPISYCDFQDSQCPGNSSMCRAGICFDRHESYGIYGWVSNISFSDKYIFVSGKEDDRIVAYNPSKSALEFVMDANSGSITGMRLDRLGSKLYSIDMDRNVRVWDTESKVFEYVSKGAKPTGSKCNEAENVPCPNSNEVCALSKCYLPDEKGHMIPPQAITLTSKWVITSSWKNIKIWGYSSSGYYLVNNRSIVPDTFLKHKLTNNGEYLIMLTFWGKVIKYSLPDLEVIGIYGKEVDKLYSDSLDFHPTRGFFVVGYSNGDLKFFNSYGQILHFTSMDGEITDIKFSPDGNVLAVATLQGKVYFYRIE